MHKEPIDKGLNISILVASIFTFVILIASTILLSTHIIAIDQVKYMAIPLFFTTILFKCRSSTFANKAVKKLTVLVAISIMFLIIAPELYESRSLSTSISTTPESLDRLVAFMLGLYSIIVGIMITKITRPIIAQANHNCNTDNN